ncbi:MAG TPA: sodium-translocating pyrophosphatase [Thermomicrobiales bacterium]|nr:sodium-translocating pyrophosphatase [Thermomicrobiales bacterium]
MDNLVLYLLPVVVFGLVAIGYAIWLARDVLSRDQGTAAMQDISGRIFEGANAYLNRQYRTIYSIAIIVAIVIGVLVAIFEHDHKATRGVITAIAFLVGAILSGISGFIGMYVAVKSNVRTAAAAREGTGPAMTIALRGGAVSGFLVIALGLVGVLAVYGVVYQFADGDGNPAVAETPFWIVGYAFGASFVALFAQLGGGIYTKAADVGADLVGKVEAGIPEDDPRNPAVIADLVGDNVGDCAGRGADIFESSAAEMIGAMILGVALFHASGGDTESSDIIWIFFPLIIAAFGLIASILGVMAVRPEKHTKNPMNELNRGFYVAAGASAILLVILCMFLPYGKWQFALCGLIGLITAFAFLFITQYYTEGNYRPVKGISEASKTGPATNIISGISVGFETTGLSALVVGAALLSSYYLGRSVDGFESDIAISSGIFGTAVATMGMLMTAAYILAMDTFGPITDNAGGIVEMSDAPEEIRDVTDSLDSVGNTTKALTKGYAVASASLAAFLLFSAYLDEVQRFADETISRVVNLAEPRVFVGALIGAALVYVFSSFAMSAVGRAATDMIEEVRRQFHEDPGIMAGTSKPDYRACVDISVRSALREMILPGSLAVVVPILVGVILRWEAAAGMLMVGTIVGVLMALVMNNGGGAWDNAKKTIEAGQLTENGVVLGKGSDAHAAAVVGDTVGDPWKDTAGPSLHVLVKLLATITLVLAPLFI